MEIRCRNPWRKGCENVDIVVFIVYKGKKLPICRDCWRTIARSGREW